MHVLCADGADPVEKDAALYVRGDLPSAMQGWMLCGDLRGSLCFPAFMSNTPETDEVAVQRVGGRPDCGSAEEYPSSSKACVGFVAVRSN